MKMSISIPKKIFGQRLPGPLRFLQNRRMACDGGQAVRAGLGRECLIRSRPREMVQNMAREYARQSFSSYSLVSMLRNKFNRNCNAGESN